MTDKRTLYTSIEKQTHPLEVQLELVPENVMRQELKTYVSVDKGCKVITRTRTFRNATHEDSVIEEFILER
jgi:hypothetical protein